MREGDDRMQSNRLGEKSSLNPPQPVAKPGAVKVYKKL